MCVMDVLKNFIHKCKQTLLPILLVASMVTSSFSILAVTAADEVQTGSIYASDEFSGSALASEWKASGNAQVSDGTLNGKSGKTFYAYFSEKENASSWTDYSVEADITFTEAVSGKAIAGVALRSDASSWYGGYIMKLSYADKKVYLYSGNAEGSTGLVLLTSATLETVELNKNYHIKLSVTGDDLVGSLDGTKMLEYTASAENMTGKSAKKNDAGYPGVLVNNGVVTIDNFVVTDTNVIYTDIFGSSLSTDWKASGNGQVSNGTMNGKEGKTFYAYLSEKEGASSWTDYSVEADITFTEAVSGKAIAGVALRSDASGWYGGYIMKISYADKMAYLYSGKADGSNGLVSLTTSALETVELNQSYHLKLTAIGDNLVGYIDGNKVLEYTASAENMTGKSAKKNDAGYPGVLVNNGVVTVDDFSVRAEKAEASEPTPDPNPNPEPEPIVPTPIDPDALFGDGFDGTSLNSEWKASGNAQVSDGIMSGKEGKSFYAYLSEKEGASEWQDYSAEADIMITTADADGKAVAGIALRSVENSWYGGYIVKLSYADQKVYLYSAKADGTNSLVTLASAPMKIELNTVYHLRLSAIGNRLTGYVDGVSMVTYEANEKNMTEKSAKKNDKGYPGVLVNNGTVQIDNFVVYKQEDTTGANNVNVNDYWFYENFESEEMPVSKGWHTNSVQMYDGGALLTTGQWNLYLTGIEDAMEWTDYSVEADVIIRPDLDTAEGTGTPIAAIVARSTGQNTGIEFGIASGTSGNYVRLYDRTAGKTLATTKNITITEGTTYHLQMLVVGNTVRGYLNNELVIEYTGNIPAKGSIGIRNGATSAIFDNVIVKSTSMVDLSRKVTSPLTGDIYSISTVMTVFIISFATMVLCIAYYAIMYKKEKVRRNNNGI